MSIYLYRIMIDRYFHFLKDSSLHEIILNLMSMGTILHESIPCVTLTMTCAFCVMTQ